MLRSPMPTRDQPVHFLVCELAEELHEVVGQQSAGFVAMVGIFRNAQQLSHLEWGFI